MQIKTLLWVAAFVAAPLITSCGDSDGDITGSTGNTGGQLANSSSIHILSNRADLISGGDALVEVIVPEGASADAISVRLNGRDVSDRFAPTAEGNLRGLVTGLEIGKNRLMANLPGGNAVAELINHPNGGPVFSGPQLQPWTCNNEAAVDDKCNQPPEFRFFYKSTDPMSTGLQPYDPENPPDDVAMTTTDHGVTVPFIVREETGYQNRDEYKIAVLFQPGQPWTATEPQAQFNNKLLTNHGFSCGVDYESGNAPPVIPSNTTDTPVVGGELLPFGLPVEVLRDATEMALGRGFAVASAALNWSGHNCNLALQAEAMVMVKERVIEQYGDLRYTIGEGCSGGSLAIQWMANAYPGIYQGILPTCSFPDTWSTATQFLDYHLTLDYFLDPSQWGPGIVWLEPQMAAVQDHISIVNSQVSDNAQFSVAVPTTTCGGIEEGEQYHPENNPDGVRCAVQDAAINVFAPRPEEIWSEVELMLARGFAGFPVDNVGVQYGLKALQQGLITPAQFVDLNVKIGGLDVDTNIIDERLEAVEPALTNAYRSGMINVGNNMDKVAIIDCRGPDPGAFHDAYRAYAMRARLDREHGHHDNQLIWEGPALILGDNDCAKNSFVAMDRWLTAVEQDESDTLLAEKIVSNKPEDLQDACFSGTGQKISDGVCGDAVVGVYGTPRTGAGDAITTDTNKCQLKPLNREDDYGPIPFTDEQWTQLEALFPEGVCDFSKPGVSHQGTVPWQTYQDNNGDVIYGGTVMPPAPDHSGVGWAAPSFQVFAE